MSTPTNASPTPQPKDAHPTPPTQEHQYVQAPELSATERRSRWIRLGVLSAAVVALGYFQGLSMLIVIAALVIMIFMHELGHFLVARWSGMLCTEFFIGFGPKIWSFTRGETEYGIKAIPAGAYVRIVGMSRLEEVPPELESRTYRQKPFHQRFGVAVAGSTMHFLMAIALLAGSYFFVGAPHETDWQVGNVTTGSAADLGGIEVGDVVLSLNGQVAEDFESFREAIQQQEAGPATVIVDRDGQEETLTVQLSSRSKIIGTIREDIDILDTGSKLQIGALRQGGVATSAGLHEGEEITAINAQPVSSMADIESALSSSVGGRLSIETLETSEPIRVDLGSEVALAPPAAFLGVGADPVLVKQGPVTAISSAASTFGEVVKVSIEGIGRFFYPPNIWGFLTDAVSGIGAADTVSEATAAESTPSAMSETRPISIVGVAMIGSDISTHSIVSLLIFLAQINIFIGVFNLFPMLPFDGGHVVIACYEKIREMISGTRERYMADVSKMMPVAYGLLGVLLVVGLLAIFVDVTRGVNL